MQELIQSSIGVEEAGATYDATVGCFTLVVNRDNVASYTDRSVISSFTFFHVVEDLESEEVIYESWAVSLHDPCTPDTISVHQIEYIDFTVPFTQAFEGIFIKEFLLQFTDSTYFDT